MYEGHFIHEHCPGNRHRHSKRESCGLRRRKKARVVAESLGLVTQAYKEISNELIQALSKALVDEDAIVVRNATFSISQLGAAANTQLILERIDHNLPHWHHHVRGWSIETLQRLENPIATRLALNYLMAARWDPAHKSGDIAQTAKVMHKAT